MSEGHEDEESDSGDDGGSRDGDYTLEDLNEDLAFLTYLKRFFPWIHKTGVAMNAEGLLRVVNNEIDFPISFSSDFAPKLQLASWL